MSRNGGPSKAPAAVVAEDTRTEWPVEELDLEFARKEAKWAQSGNIFDFKRPEELGVDPWSKHTNRYVKFVNGEPVAQNPPRIHESSDIPAKKKKRTKEDIAAEKAAARRDEEHPKIAAATDDTGYADPDVVNWYHGLPHHINMPLAGVAPEDRAKFNEELRASQREKGLPPLKKLPDPLADKRRKQQQTAAAAARPSTTRASRRVSGRGPAPGDERIFKQDIPQAPPQPENPQVNTGASSATLDPNTAADVVHQIQKAEHVRKHPTSFAATNGPSREVAHNYVADSEVVEAGPSQTMKRGVKRQASEGAEDSKPSKKPAAASTRAELHSKKPTISKNSRQPQKPDAKSTTSAGSKAADNDPQGAAKRRRIDRACGMCRVKKTKCDGNRPCDACNKRGFTCSYGNGGAVTTDKPQGGGSPGEGPSGEGPSGNEPKNGNGEAQGSKPKDARNGASAGRGTRTNRCTLNASAAGISTSDITKPMQRKRKHDSDHTHANVVTHPQKRFKTDTSFTTHGSSESADQLTEKSRDPTGGCRQPAESTRKSVRPVKLRVLIPKDISGYRQILGVNILLPSSHGDMEVFEHVFHGTIFKFRIDLMRNKNVDDAKQEDSFHNKPSIKLWFPDHLKGLLVDDWENVTKSQQLVELPHKKATVEKILRDYLEHERPCRNGDDTQIDILEETISGLREYFDKALGRILLYR